MRKYLYTRKHNGEEYRFYLYDMVSWVTGELEYFISVETPENALGYPDTVLLSESGKAYTLHRYDTPRWILDRLAKQMQAALKKEAPAPAANRDKGKARQ